MSNFVYLAFVVSFALAGLLLMVASIRKIPVDHRGVLFRWGRLVRELPAGTAWVIPLVDQVMLVDLREQSFALPPDLVYTEADDPAQRYRVQGQFTCRVLEPIPVVIAAMQARQDIVQVVGNKLLAEIGKMGRAAVRDRPAQAQQSALAALNEEMAAAWQLKLTKLEFTLVPPD